MGRRNLIMYVHPFSQENRGKFSNSYKNLKLNLTDNVSILN